MAKEMQIEILNGRETLVNCQFKSNKNLNLNLYREIPRSANPIQKLDSTLYREIPRNLIFSILISEWVIWNLVNSLAKSPPPDPWLKTTHMWSQKYGVATISRLLKIIGRFCKTDLQKRRYSGKETYNFKKPTNLSHPISVSHGIREVGGWGRVPFSWEVGGWGRVPFSRNLMSPTPRRKWYLTTGRRAH